MFKPLLNTLKQPIMVNEPDELTVVEATDGVEFD